MGDLPGPSLPLVRTHEKLKGAQFGHRALGDRGGTGSGLWAALGDGEEDRRDGGEEGGEWRKCTRCTLEKCELNVARR